MSTETAPVAPSARIASIDALRGFALIGILLINIVGFGFSLEWGVPFGLPTLASADWRVWIAEHVLFEGAMRGLFSMLFGAGMLLFLRESQDEAARAGRTKLFLRRSALLVAFGVVNSTVLLWPGDILLTYGLSAFLVLPFARVSIRSLLAVATATLVTLSIWAAINATTYPHEPLLPTDPTHLAEGAARAGGYLDNLVYMTGTTLAWTFSAQTLWWVLEAAAFMLAGMALLRLGVLNGQASTRAYALLAAIGFGVAIPLNAAEAAAMWRAAGTVLPWTELTSQIGRTALTLGYIGLFHLAWRTLPHLLFAPLAALGRMALTGYLGQSLICALLFGGFGLGLWGKLTWPQLWLLIIPIMAFEASFAILWLRAFRFGPVEWLWRSLTYGRRQPMRRV